MTSMLSSPRRGVWLLTFPPSASTPGLLDEVLARLDQVEAEHGTMGGPGALVLAPAPQGLFSVATDVRANVLPAVEQLARRLVACPLATVAVLDGHAFGYGLLLSLCCDVRLITPRGSLALGHALSEHPRSALGRDILAAKVPNAKAHEAVISGNAWTAEQAVRGGIVDAAVQPREVVNRAVAVAEGTLRPDTVDLLARRASATLAARTWPNPCPIVTRLPHLTNELAGYLLRLLPDQEAVAAWAKVELYGEHDKSYRLKAAAVKAHL
ncbi:uncharacterized protein EHS24_008205 [Apiotrichum porosum]|uniref:Uncharacterized protein n=1 Tax=Apiotrichum porosum TaxID=105984 RepID=A0A427XSV3_9TREE|nr:uncharacterized protein EHS24_008205 [Apiotrichum porosum]RSH82002.1 hypothetical protein EHS24_008205 [Apiotrichum porosum]